MLQKIFISLLLISGIAIQSTAQTSADSEGGRMAQGIVKGSVIDASHQEPMEFVNVALYRVKDSVLITGTITKEDGNFTISAVKPGNYYIQVNFIGFHKKTIDDITISRKSPVVDLGVIRLSSSSRELDGVEVVGTTDRIEYEIDRKIINVAKDLSSSGGSAVDVLQNTPSVEVDIEDNVSLRGSSSFTVLIDGKPTSLDANDVLKQTPASSIERIEIITNPSVKFDPEGGSGIINLVMKKRKRTGFNGIVNASAGNQDTYKGDFLLNYRTGNFNWYVGAEYSERNYYSDAIMDRETYGDTSTIMISSERDRIWSRGGKSAQAGMDYYINDEQTLSFSTRLGEYTFGHSMDSETENYTSFDNYPSTSPSYALDKSMFERSGLYWEGTVSYDYKIDENGQKLELSGFFSRRDNDEIDNQETFITGADYKADENPDNSIETSEDEDSYRFRFNADYTLPIRKTGKLEMGLQSKYNSDNIDYHLDGYDFAGGGVDMGEFADRRFEFHQNIQAAYIIYSKKFSFMDMKAGLRGEYTDRELSNRDTSETYGINRFDLFPSLHLSRKFNDENQLMASYSRRINRPRGWYLDPFLSYRDQYTLRKGNPDLEPEYTDSYELTYLRYFKKGFLSFETFFRQSNNRIERVPQLYPDDPGIIMMTFQNVNKDQSLGSELMLNLPITSWLKINTSGTIYNYKIYDDKDEVRQDNTWNIRGNTDINISKSMRLQLTAFYSGPSITSTGTRGDMFMTSAALRQDLMDDQLNLIFRVHDIFGTRGREIITDQEAYYVKMEHINSIPRISLGVTYKINNYKRKAQQRQEQGEDIDMEF
ncbi:MAG: TonB-dependent receptor domain-containing protein [Bacteroidota bacterium]